MSTSHRRKSSAAVPIGLGLLGLAVLLTWLVWVKGPPSQILAQLVGGASSSLPPASPFRVASTTTQVPTAQPLLPPLGDASTAMPPLFIYAITSAYPDPSAPTPTPISTPGGSCGHKLDEPFGAETKLIIHKVGGADSLNRYEILYRTSVEAILAINLPFPIPVRPNRILVIALDTADASGLPAFAPLEVSNRNTAIETMAFKVSADLLAFQKYNDFDESCRNFIGWVLAPREKPVP